MCGIVGLLLKKPALREQLGELMVPMLVGMTERGPDSAGARGLRRRRSTDSQHKLQLVLAARRPWTGRNCWRRIAARVRRASTRSRRHGNHAVLTSAGRSRRSSRPGSRTTRRRSTCCRWADRSISTRTSARRRISPSATASRRCAARIWWGTRAWRPNRPSRPRMRIRSRPGRTSAWCTTARCPIRIWCASSLEPLGIDFETDNDTEAACRFLEWRMREGDDLTDRRAARLRRARRLLHVPDGHRQGTAHRARCLRLQAGGGGRDRRLRRHRLGVPLAGASARTFATRRCSSPSRKRSIHGEFEPCRRREFDLARDDRLRELNRFLHRDAVGAGMPHDAGPESRRRALHRRAASMPPSTCEIDGPCRLLRGAA